MDTTAILSFIKDNLPTTFVVVGFFFLLLSVVNQVTGKITVDPTRRTIALVIGLGLVVAGLLLLFEPGLLNRQKPSSPLEIARSALEAQTPEQLAKILEAEAVCDPLGRRWAALGWFLMFSHDNPAMLGEKAINKMVSWHYQNKSFHESLSLDKVDEIALAQIEGDKIKRFVVYFPDESIADLRRACEKAGNPEIWEIKCPDFISMAQTRAAQVSPLQRGDGSPELPGC